MRLNNQKVWLDLHKYKGKWVALNQSEEKIVSSNKNAKTAYEDAVKKGVTIPILFKVPKIFTPYIGSI